MEALDYNREAAEAFGRDAHTACRCAGSKDHPEMADGFIERAERFARIAFHFAARATSLLDERPRHITLCDYCKNERGRFVELDVLGACPCCARLGTEVR